MSTTVGAPNMTNYDGVVGKGKNVKTGKRSAEDADVSGVETSSVKKSLDETGKVVENSVNANNDVPNWLKNTRKNMSLYWSNFIEDWNDPNAIRKVVEIKKETYETKDKNGRKATGTRIFLDYIGKKVRIPEDKKNDHPLKFFSPPQVVTGGKHCNGAGSANKKKFATALHESRLEIRLGLGDTLTKDDVPMLTGTHEYVFKKPQKNPVTNEILRDPNTDEAIEVSEVRKVCYNDLYRNLAEEHDLFKKFFMQPLCDMLIEYLFNAVENAEIVKKKKDAAIENYIEFGKKDYTEEEVERKAFLAFKKHVESKSGFRADEKKTDGSVLREHLFAKSFCIAKKAELIDKDKPELGLKFDHPEWKKPDYARGSDALVPCDELRKMGYNYCPPRIYGPGGDNGKKLLNGPPLHAKAAWNRPCRTLIHAGDVCQALISIGATSGENGTISLKFTELARLNSFPRPSDGNSWGIEGEEEEEDWDAVVRDWNFGSNSGTSGTGNGAIEATSNPV